MKYLKYLDCKHVEYLRTATVLAKTSCPETFFHKVPARVVSLCKCKECYAYQPREDGEVNTFKGGN